MAFAFLFRGLLSVCTVAFPGEWSVIDAFDKHLLLPEPKFRLNNFLMDAVGDGIRVNFVNARNEPVAAQTSERYLQFISANILGVVGQLLQLRREGRL